MKSTSPGTRLDSSAARSPACWIAGPLDIRRGRLDSWATIIASVVLPSPGGPASRMWSGVRFCRAAASRSSCSWPRTFDWPTNSASERGRRAPSKASSVSDSGVGLITRSAAVKSAGSSRRRRSRRSPRALRTEPGQRRAAAAPAPSRAHRRSPRRSPPRRPAPRPGRSSRVRPARRSTLPVTWCPGRADRDGRGRSRRHDQLARQRHDDQLRGLRADARDLAERRVVLRGDRLRDLDRSQRCRARRAPTSARLPTHRAAGRTPSAPRAWRSRTG